MVTRLLDWLGANRWINLLILTIYYLAVVLPHEEFGLWISDMFRPYTRDSYNRVLLLCAIGVFLAYAVIMYRGMKELDYKRLLFYFCINLIFAIVCINLLFVVNVEAIHFLQYGLFAILCFPLINNYTLTLVYTTLAGAIDEAYQFYYLAPERTDYYDFNDVVINLVGAVFGLILIRSLARKTYLYQWLSFRKSKHFLFFGLLILSIIILFVTGILVKEYNPENLKAMYWLISKPVTGFWTFDRAANISFHVIQPWEGLLIVLLLFLIYSGIYKGVGLLNKE